MKYQGDDWFHEGRLADGYNWESIPAGRDNKTLCYEKDWSLAGCSGYVQFEMNGTKITIAFSNPASGTNKLSVGTSVWDDMESHDYAPFDVDIAVGGSTLRCHCKCTGGTTNEATINIKEL